MKYVLPVIIIFVGAFLVTGLLVSIAHYTILPAWIVYLGILSGPFIGWNAQRWADKILGK